MSRTALVIDRTPQIHLLAGDPYHHLVEMPAIARPKAMSAQPSGDHRGTVNLSHRIS
jgi:hypothetical protein